MSTHSHPAFSPATRRGFARLRVGCRPRRCRRSRPKTGHAETAFFVPLAGEPERFHLRWFTPGAEVDLCGHATLATAFVLKECLGFNAPAVHFDTRRERPADRLV